MFGGHTIQTYDLRCVIKETQSASIYLAKHRLNGDLLALKKCHHDSLDEVTFRLIENEIITMRQLSHPNILVIHEAFVQISDIFIVHPLMRYGSCQDVMDRFCCVGFPEIIVSLIARDVLLALDYLHRKKYIHRSVRASHVLLGDHAVLTGFKECANLCKTGQRIRKLHKLPTSSKELVWLAPEVLEQNLLGYTEKSDIYSFGITLCELANNLTPFAEMPKTLMYVEKLRGNQPSLLDCSTYTSEMLATELEEHTHQELRDFAIATRQVYSQRKLSDAFHNFVEVCLKKDPANRLATDKLLSHPFIRQSRHTSLQLEMDELKIDSIDAMVPIAEEELSHSLSDIRLVEETGDAISWDFE